MRVDRCDNDNCEYCNNADGVDEFSFLISDCYDARIVNGICDKCGEHAEVHDD